ncbi:hypothetical protein [Candidatus Hecatella orcuttiae]|uniref:hypothetical protein n=1 Tax=Candidatus Hecatella orcuttiae TaxID=1935119 RepID=UPI00286818B3|nr:hypothetical protein [Candidatus Hecatella orcuttiae]
MGSEKFDLNISLDSFPDPLLKRGAEGISLLRIFSGVKWKDLGVGREGIGYSIEEMTYLKTIIFNMEPAGLGKVRHVHRM